MIAMVNFRPLFKQPHDGEGPIFSEPWQAQAFVLAIQLNELGLFTWKEWTETISGEIKKAQDRGDPDLGNTYYEHWLNALESLAHEKGLLNVNEVVERKEAWRQAYLDTPHGRPVELKSISQF